MNYIIQAFKALEDIDDDAVVVKPKAKKPLKESMEDYYVLSDGMNPKNSQVFASLKNVDEFIKDLETKKPTNYIELLHYVNGNPKKIWDSKDGRVQESCEVKEDSRVELHPEYDSRQSFYGKARVIIKDDGTQILYSYATPVCKIKDGKVTLLKKGYLGWASSPTTLRHVKEFLKQNGFEAGSYKELAKMYPVEQAGINEDYNDLDDSWDGIVADTITKVKEVLGIELSDRDIHFDDSRAWSFYVYGNLLDLPVFKFGAYRNYMGGGVRGSIEHNGRKQDGTYELGEFFAEQLKRIEDLINAGYEDEEAWLKPTGVLSDSLKEEKINENNLVSLNNKEEVEEAVKKIEDDTPEEEVERIIDVDAETVDKLKDSYVGDVILICKKCRTPVYKKPEDVKKDEETGLYNLEEECSHCGASEGFELGGQVGKFDAQTEDEKEQAKEEEQEVEVKEVEKEKKVSPIEDEENDNKFESLDDTKFNSLVTKYLKEVYSNVDSFETKDGSIEDDKVIIEGTIKYTSEKTKDVKFIFENISRTAGNKVKLVGINEALTNNKDAFTIIATIKDNALICETLKYNYKITLNEEETLVRGRTSLREQKKEQE